MLKRLFATLFLFVCILLGQAQALGQRSEDEQSKFAVEDIPGEPRVTHPLAVPDKVVEVLQTDEAVKSCRKDNPIHAGQSLSSWFVASLIHLGGPKQADVVVVPSFNGEESMCFQTPAGIIGMFWLFRQHGQRYELVLRTWGGGFEILPSRTNGYRDVRTGTLGQAGRALTNLDFHFDGTRYVEDRERTSEQR